MHQTLGKAKPVAPSRIDHITTPYQIRGRLLPNNNSWSITVTDVFKIANYTPRNTTTTIPPNDRFPTLPLPARVWKPVWSSQGGHQQSWAWVEYTSMQLIILLPTTNNKKNSREIITKKSVLIIDHSMGRRSMNWKIDGRMDRPLWSPQWNTFLNTILRGQPTICFTKSHNNNKQLKKASEKNSVEVGSLAPTFRVGKSIFGDDGADDQPIILLLSD